MKRGKGRKWRAWALVRVNDGNFVDDLYGRVSVYLDGAIAKRRARYINNGRPKVWSVIEVEISTREPNAPRRGRGGDWRGGALAREVVKRDPLLKRLGKVRRAHRAK